MINLEPLFVLLALIAHWLFKMDVYQTFTVFGFWNALAKLYLLVVRANLKFTHKKSPSRSAKFDGKDSHLSL